jgi:hypothetical protein
MPHPGPRPANFRPDGYRPGSFAPALAGVGAGGKYHVISQPTPDADAVKTTLAILDAGTLQYTLTGTPDSERWVYIRAVSACGVGDGEPIRPKLRRVAFDGDGNLIPDVPNEPRNLYCVAGAAGLVTAYWQYEPTGHMVAPATFNIYTTSGATPFDFDTPAGSVTFTGARGYSFGATFGDGVTAKFVVRAVSSVGKASGGEEPNTTEASAVADTQAPAAPEELVITGVLP